MHTCSVSRTQHLFSGFKIMVEFMAIAALLYALASVISVMIQWSHWRRHASPQRQFTRAVASSGKDGHQGDGVKHAWLCQEKWETREISGFKYRKAARRDVNSACMLFGFWIGCHFIYSGYEPLLDITIANFSPFHTSFLILLTVLHGEAFEFDVLTLVHFSFHFFCFWNYTQASLPRLMYRNTVTLPF